MPLSARKPVNEASPPKPRPPSHRMSSSIAQPVAAASIVPVEAIPVPDCPRGPLPVLYTDALHSIFAFSSMRDLNALLTVWRQWSNAVDTMPPLLAAVRCHAPFKPMCLSRLARHVGSFVELDQSKCNAERLDLFRTRLPNLRSLEWTITLAAFSATVADDLLASLVPFPRSLQRLQLTFVHPIRHQLIHDVLVCVAQSCPDIRHLHLYQPSGCGARGWGAPQIDLEPLTHMRHLQSLRLQEKDLNTGEGGRDGLLPTPEQIAVFRGLSSLESLILEPFVQRSILWQLLATPHALKWTALPVPAWTSKLGSIGDAEATLIGSLPNLTSCPTLRFTGSNMEWLRPIRALRTLSLDLQACSAEAAALVPGLQSCSHLTSLSLEHANAFRTDDWIAVLSSMPALSFLKIGYLQDGAQLACLSAVPSLARSLQDLELYECVTLSGSHLHPIQSLKALRTLRVMRCFVTAPPELKTLRAPLMPHLTVYFFKAPALVGTASSSSSARTPQQRKRLSNAAAR